MAWYEFIWLDDFIEGNIEHLAQHGFTPDDFEFVFVNYEGEEISARPVTRYDSGTLKTVDLRPSCLNGSKRTSPSFQ